ncbi:unnamed protein product [marine sediment metagenome]|uniref:Uncharacterized protein n=1 Tax=marine sediment metagenome TaxID=412755 RepID=X1LDY4_9ZZZZ
MAKTLTREQAAALGMAMPTTQAQVAARYAAQAGVPVTRTITPATLGWRGQVSVAPPQPGQETQEYDPAGPELQEWEPWEPIGAGAVPAGVAALAGIEPGTEVGAQLAEPGVGVGALAIPAVIAGAATAIPAVGTALASAAGWVMGKGLLPLLVRMGLAGGAASVAWNTIANLFGLNPADAIAVAESMKKKGKRYSIGTNPRLNTLLKVGKRVDNIFVRYDKRISKFRSRLRGYQQPRRRYAYRQEQYLSPVEKRAIRRGR